VMQCAAVCCSVLQCVAVCCSVLQCVAVRCSVLQCVAVCCSALQCVAVIPRSRTQSLSTGTVSLLITALPVVCVCLVDRAYIHMCVYRFMNMCMYVYMA